MWWKFLSGLAFGLIFGSLALAPIYIGAHQHRVTVSAAASDQASPEFRHLTAEEINRRTLKAAAAIEGFNRRY